MRNILIILSLFLSFTLNAQKVITNNSKVVISNNKALISIMPNSLSGLIAWYDSKDLATITKDGSGYVSQWKDKSGYNYHVVQANASYQPLYSATDGIAFDGVNDYLKAIFGITYSQPLTIFIVYSSQVTGVVSKSFIDGIESTKRANLGWINSTPYNTIQLFAGTVIEVIYTKISPFDFIINTAISNGVNSSIYENNVLKDTGNAGTQSLSGITLASRYSISTGEQTACKIREVIIYNKACSISEIILINNYLNSKYTIY